MHSCTWKDSVQSHRMHSRAYADRGKRHQMHSCTRKDRDRPSPDAQLYMEGRRTESSDAQLCRRGQGETSPDAQLYTQGQGQAVTGCTAVHGRTPYRVIGCTAVHTRTGGNVTRCTAVHAGTVRRRHRTHSRTDRDGEETSSDAQPCRQGQGKAVHSGAAGVGDGKNSPPMYSCAWGGRRHRLPHPRRPHVQLHGGPGRDRPGRSLLRTVRREQGDGGLGRGVSPRSPWRHWRP